MRGNNSMMEKDYQKKSGNIVQQSAYNITNKLQLVAELSPYAQPEVAQQQHHNKYEMPS